jgi:hypothetical protein
MPIRRDDIVSVFLSRQGTLLRRGRWGINLYRKRVAECSEADEDFPVKLRAVALEMLNDEQSELVRCAIQALAVVGHAADAEALARLENHQNAAVATDAKTCLFELRKLSR